MKGRLFALLRFCYLLKENFTLHQGTLRAAALTYTTALSLIPVLAIAFAILKGLGAQNTLEPLLQELAGDSQETITRIIAYVNNTNFKSIGAIGLLTLVITAISLLGSIEVAFNTIWGVTETRSLQRRFSDFLSVVVVGPILILVATSITTSLQNQWMVKWLIQRAYFGDAVLFLFKLAPYVSIWIALVFLYIYIPNSKVRFRSALLGGILAGTAWQVAQWAYFHFQVGVANYNAIYGTLAALPIFLIWVYTSWLIVLFGLEIVCTHQRRKYIITHLCTDNSSQAAFEEHALALMIQICRNFQKGGQAPVAARLSSELSLEQDLVQGTLEKLAELGYLVLTVNSEPGWLPAREPSEIKINQLLSALRGNTESNGTLPAARVLAGEIIRRLDECRRVSLDDMTLHDLLADKNHDKTDSPAT
ncbi:MAG: YihY/virulence factor BrkB family protein [Desulfuromonadales bacterium]|nr:YihY/virulence factor BrkB family protein [Desulfuromonadales bacterium]